MKAEEELKVTKTTTTTAAAPKINREGPAIAETPTAVTKTDSKPPGQFRAVL